MFEHTGVEIYNNKGFVGRKKSLETLNFKNEMDDSSEKQICFISASIDGVKNVHRTVVGGWGGT